MNNEKQELIISVYQGNGKVSSNGKYNRDNVGMVYFTSYGCNFSMAICGDSKFIAEDVASSFWGILSANKVPAIRFEYPDTNRTLTVFADGFFGRPLVFAGAKFLKPLQQRRRPALARELNKIGRIEDKKRRTIELIV